jgi:hypothetical protein
MAEPASAMCLNMAKLNLYQCLAVAKPHYEDVFCLGQHILIDTGMCVIKASGAAMPYEPPPPPKPVVPVKKPVGRQEGRPRSRPPSGAAQKPHRAPRRPAVASPGRSVYVARPQKRRRPGETIQSCAAVSHFESTGLSRETDMAEIILNVEVRDRAGTGGSRETRRQGKVPGVLYGGAKAR